MKQPYCLAQNTIFIYTQNTHTSCVYFDIKFSWFALVKTGIKKFCKIVGSMPLNMFLETKKEAHGKWRQ